MTLIATTKLCTQADMERLLSVYGVQAFSDHEQTGVADVDVVVDCIDQASEEILMYLHERYLEADLQTSPLVNRWATVVAATFLCQRRGNPVPDSLQSEWVRIMDPVAGLCHQISNGTRALPGIPLRCDMRPSFSNLRVDRRFLNNKTRVTKSNSSDSPTTLRQDADVKFYGGR
jgi:phage gp36-like protein